MLSTAAVTIRYKTNPGKPAKLALVSVSPTEVAINGSKNGLPLKDSFEAVFTVTYKGRSGDYTTGINTPGDDGTCKVAMKEVATSLLDDIGGLLSPSFDAAGTTLSIEEPVTVSVRLTPTRARASADAVADRAAKAAEDAYRMYRRGQTPDADVAFWHKYAAHYAAETEAVDAPDPAVHKAAKAVADAHNEFRGARDSDRAAAALRAFMAKYAAYYDTTDKASGELRKTPDPKGAAEPNKTLSAKPGDKVPLLNGKLKVTLVAAIGGSGN